MGQGGCDRMTGALGNGWSEVVQDRVIMLGAESSYAESWSWSSCIETCSNMVLADGKSSRIRW